MAVKKNETIVYFYQIPDVHKYWGWFLALGLLLIIMGAFALGFSYWATALTVILLGFFLGGAGILLCVSSVYAIKWSGFFLTTLLGVFYLIAGCLCIFNPMQSAVTISMLIALLLLIGGSFRLITALRLRFDDWGLVVFNGLTAIILGILILAKWPASAMRVIGLFVGIDLLLMGFYWVRLSLAARK